MLKRISKSLITFSVLFASLLIVRPVFAETVFPDANFGADGKVAIDNPIKNSNTFYPKQIERAINGGYIIGSYIKSDAGDYDIVMCKVNSSGGPDSNFGTNDNGCETYGSTANDYFSSFIKTSDGKYLVVGYSWAGGAVDENIYVLMINSDGSLNSSFDGDGVLLIGEENNSEQLGYAAIEDNGSYIIVGTSREGSVGGKDAFLTKIDETGAVDTTFGTSGELMFGGWEDEDLKSIVNDGNGDFILGGYEGWGGFDRDFYFAKVTADGALDTSFGTNGEVFIDIVDDEYGENIIRLSNGNFLLQGTGETGGTTFSYLVTIDDTGALVGSFGSGGYYQFPIDTNIGDILEDTQNRLLVTGDKLTAGVTQLFLQRLTLDGVADTSLNNGYSYYTYSNFADTTNPIYGKSITFENSTNSAVIGGYFQNTNGTLDSIILRLTNGYHITGLPDSVKVTADGNQSIKIGSTHAVYSPTGFTLKKDDFVVFKGEVTLTDDTYWGNLNLMLSLTDYKVIFDPSAGVGGITDGDYIYVPKRADNNFVVLCPGAKTFADLHKECPNASILHINSNNVNIINNNGREFWQIETNEIHIGGYSYTEDDSSKPVTITQMHKFTDIPDYHDIEFYSTSQWVYIKGTTEPNALVTFLTDTQKFTTSSTSNGDFAIKITIGTGIAHVDVDYFSTSNLGVNSVFKNLKLHIGCETFPNDLYAMFCSNTQKELDLLKDEEEDSGYQMIEDDNNDIFDDPLLDDQFDTERRKNYEQITTKKLLLQMLDISGEAMTSAALLIDGEEYTTNGLGQVEIEVAKEAEEVIVTYSDGVAQTVTLGNASFVKVQKEAELNSLPLLLAVVLIPSIIVSYISVKLAGVFQRRRSE